MNINGPSSDPNNALPPPPPGLGSIPYNSSLHSGISGASSANTILDAAPFDRYGHGMVDNRFERQYYRTDGPQENVPDEQGYSGYSMSKEGKIKNIPDDNSSVGSEYDLQRTQFSSYSVMPPSQSVSNPPGSNRSKTYNQSFGKAISETGSGNIPLQSYSNNISSNPNSAFYGGQQGNAFRTEEGPQSGRQTFPNNHGYNQQYYDRSYNGPDGPDMEHHQQQQQQQHLYQQQQAQLKPNHGGSLSARMTFKESQQQQHALEDEQMYAQLQHTPTHHPGPAVKPPLPYNLPTTYKQQQQAYPNNALLSRSNSYTYAGREGASLAPPAATAALPSPSSRMAYSNYQQTVAVGYQNPVIGGGGGMMQYSPKHSGGRTPPSSGTGGSNAQGRAINKMLLDILRERVIDPQRLELAIETYTERMDCVNVATLLFHTGKKRLLLSPAYIARIASRLMNLKEELRAREASNALYGLKCMSSDVPEVKDLVSALALKLSNSSSEFLAQAVGNALYGCQMMTSDYEEVRHLLSVLAMKVGQCTEHLEAQNVGNALYGLRGMNSDHKEVRAVIHALTSKIASAREDLNGQALGNSLYGLQSMSSKEPEVRCLLAVLAGKVSRTWEELKAQEVGNALYGLKRMSTDVAEVRNLIGALVPKVANSPEILDAQAIGNSFYGLQNMQSDSSEVLNLLQVMAQKVALSCPELDGQAMGNSLYGLQGMSSDYPEVRAVVKALTTKLQTSGLEMNAQEMGNAIYGLQKMTSEHADVRRLVAALTQKVVASKYELTSQEIGNAMFGLQGMSSAAYETRMLVKQLALKIQQSHTVLDPQGVSNSLFGIQRMSSDSDEVKLLVQALANKTEHSWKALSPQHISNALFGIQCLCSADKEVRNLLKVLEAKIVTCRDEMTSKQLGYALFGLRNMNSDRPEVLGLVAALAEKVSFSTDGWSLQSLSMAIFGMQGMNSDADEVALLLNALASKCNTIDLSTGDREFNFKMLSNLLFGMQRMSTSSLNVCTILKYMPSVLTATATAFKPADNKLFTPAMCANILFGLQGCSCTNQAVSHLLRFVSQSIKTILGSARKDVTSALRYPQGGDQFNPNQQQRPNYKNADVEFSFEELLSLYQSLVLALFAMTDISSDGQLNSELSTHVLSLMNVLESRQSEFIPKPLSTVETRLIHEVAFKLNAEPFDICSDNLVYGFEMAVYISLNCSVPLTTLSGADWSPKLNIEVQGSSYNSPTKALFYNLRNGYLQREKGVVVASVPADSFREARDLQSHGRPVSGLRNHPSVFDALYPPTAEDAETINTTLISLGKLPNTGGLMSSVASSAVDYSASYDSSGKGRRVPQQGAGGMLRPNFDNEAYFQDPTAGDVMTGIEYFDDDFNVANSGVNDPKKGPRIVNSSKSPRNRKPMGIYLGWLGAWPTVLFSGYCVSPISLSGNALDNAPGRHTNRFGAAASGGEMTSPNQSIGASAPGSSPYQGYATRAVTKSDKRETSSLADDGSNVPTTAADTVNDNRFRSSLNLSLNLSLLQPREGQPVQTPSMPYRSHYEDEEQLPTPTSRLNSYNSAYDHLPIQEQPMQPGQRYSPAMAYSRRESTNQNNNNMTRTPVMNTAMSQSNPNTASTVSMAARISAVPAPSGGLENNDIRRIASADSNDDAGSMGSSKVGSRQMTNEEVVAEDFDGRVEGEDEEDVDATIALLEAQLEVARLEAKIQSLRNQQKQKAKTPTHAQQVAAMAAQQVASTAVSTLTTASDVQSESTGP